MTLNAEVLDRKLSRRQLLKVAAATGGALLLSQVVGSDRQDAHAQPQTNEELAKTPHQPSLSEASNTIQQLTDRETSLLDTVKETAIFTVGNVAVNRTAQAVGLPITASSERNKQMIGEKAIQLLPEGVVAAPLIEEGLYRLLPNILLSDSSHSSRWEIGVPTSLVFAYMHNFQDNEKPKEYKFTKDKFPLFAFLAGMFLWRVQRERGYKHAVTTHATINAIIILTRRLLYEFFPKSEQPRKG